MFYNLFAAVLSDFFYISTLCYKYLTSLISVSSFIWQKQNNFFLINTVDKSIKFDNVPPTSQFFSIMTVTAITLDINFDVTYRWLPTIPQGRHSRLERECGSCRSHWRMGLAQNCSGDSNGQPYKGTRLGEGNSALGGSSTQGHRVLRFR